jgi:predicted dehydrogenase
MKPLKVGLVGGGRWGKNIVRTILEEIPEINIHRFVTGNPIWRDVVGQRCVFSENWKDLLFCGDIDAVILAIPSYMHYEVASEFIKANIPLMMEKPMALNRKEADALCELGELKKPIVRVDHIDLHNAAINYVYLQHVSGNKILSIDGLIGASYEKRAEITPLWEYSPHFIAVALQFAKSRLIKLQASFYPSEIKSSEHELVKVKMFFENGFFAKFIVGNGMLKKTRRMRLVGSKKIFLFDDQVNNRLFTEELAQDLLPVPNISNERPLTSAIKSFGLAVSKGKPDFDDLYMGQNVVQILELATTSLNRGGTTIFANF